MGWKFNPFSGSLDQVGAAGTGGGAQYIDGEVAGYTDLPLDETAALDSAWLVREASGVWPVSRKQAGIYIRTATGGTSRDADWTYAGTLPDVFSDANFTVYDDADPTKAVQLSAAGITAGTTRTLTVPDASGTVALVATTATAAQGAAADQYRVDVDTYGFLNQTETTLAFNPTGGTGGTGQFTIAPVGTTWSYYHDGVKHTITGAKSVDVPAGTSTTTFYFLYLTDGTGAVTCSTEAWNLDDDGKVPIATIVRNSTLTPAYLLAEERHTVGIPRKSHRTAHSTGGALYSSGGTLSGYTLSSSTDTNKTFACTPVVFFDEDIKLTTEALPDGNATSDTNYTIMYRTGVGAWAWERSLMPFKYSGTGAIQFDSSGTMTAATAGAGGSTRWVNYWIVATNVAGGTQETIVFVPGRAQHTTAAAAAAETWGSLDMTGFPCAEGVAIWQLTFSTNGANLGLCQLRSATRVTGSISTAAAPSPTAHNALSGLQGGADGDYYHLPAGTTDADVATWDEATGAWISAAPSGGGATNLWIPASAWIPKTTAGCGVDSRETATNDQNFDELLFDAGTAEFADALVVMPSNYNNGTVTARFYWTAASGSGTVAFTLKGRALANDDPLDTAAGTAQSATDTLITAEDMHVSGATSAITIAGTPAANTPIQFTISRDVANDDLAVDARLLGVEVAFN